MRCLFRVSLRVRGAPAPMVVCAFDPVARKAELSFIQTKPEWFPTRELAEDALLCAVADIEERAGPGSVLETAVVAVWG